MKALADLLFTAQPQRLPNEEQTEVAQTRIRLAILVAIACYIGFMGGALVSPGGLMPWAKTILLYYAFYTPAALGLLWWVMKVPGHFPIRRLLAMTLDYVSLGYSIVVEPTIMMPLHTVILWITVGNGLRFGKTYLWIATGYAVVTISVVCWLVPPTKDAPFMLAMFLLSAVAVPQYASSLLARVEQARREADEASLAKSRFLAQASHDLRQPLHAISLFTTSLQETGLNKPQRQIVDRIDRALQSVARLFRSLLDISTLDSGTMAPNPEPVALGDLFREIIQQNVQIAEWDNSELRMVDTSLVVLTDRAILLTMVQNLVSNALKYSAGRGVIIGCRRRGSSITIEVWDQGNGIADEHFAFLFNEFYQIKERGDRDRQGVGLGLSIVARMAALLDLRVEVASRVGKGSRFSIAGLRPLSNDTIHAAVAPVRDGRHPLKGLTVLLVEDDSDVLEATAGLLSSWGCNVIAETGIPQPVPSCDLVITDFDLGGGKTGTDCIETVRQSAGFAVPALIITGHDENRIAAEINDPGILVLKKPLRPAELRSTISSIRATLHPN